MTPRYQPGTVVTNHRGQAFVSAPAHPNARRDGLVPRSHLMMATKLGRPIRRGERVLHVDGDPSNDSPENLALFASNRDLQLWRARRA